MFRNLIVFGLIYWNFGIIFGQNIQNVTELCKIHGIIPMMETATVIFDNLEDSQQNPNTDGIINGTIDTEISRTTILLNADDIHTNNYCECNWEDSMPWGIMHLNINCGDRKYENQFFSAEILPLNTQRLDLSWNLFTFVPDFIGLDLRWFTIAHNLIETIDDNNFKKISQSLIELDLSWNRIDSIAQNAFNGLRVLEHLDLTGNHLKYLQTNIFSSLLSLNHLILSKNLQLNETFNTLTINLYLTLGVTPKLQSLEIEESNLRVLDLTHAVGLQKLNLKYNNFIAIPTTIPFNIEYFEFSGNPLKNIGPKCLPNLFQLHTIILEDMDNLTEINDYAFAGLPNIKHLSLDGSKKLNVFSSLAFGNPPSSSDKATTTLDDNEMENVTDENGIKTNNHTSTDDAFQLNVLNLRGTKLETLNRTLLFVLRNITELHLDGNPFVCDCNVKWLKDLPIETNAECNQPVKLKGKLLSQLPGAVFMCKQWQGWVYKFANGLLILLLLILCGVAIWLIVMGIRPTRRTKLQKLGSSSPYARVTIEPNRAENIY